MSETSSRLGLPYMMAAQAQKHVTHNEALERLDALVQLTVVDFDADTPPVGPVDGQIWATGTFPVNEWAAHPASLAVWSNGGWFFVAPQIGWRAARGDELRVWSGTAWDFPAIPALQNLPGVGIATTYDATNRLAVAAEATLLTHAGAGHQLKLNKATATDTASLVFQTGFSGRAEMGTAGSDAFEIKVSADGSAWQTGLALDPASGTATLPAGASLTDGTAAIPALRFASDTNTGLFSPAADALGLAAGGTERLRLTTTGCTISVPITGTAVTQSSADTTANRLMKVGDFGLGGTVLTSLSGNVFQTGLPTGFYYARPAGSGGATDAPFDGNWNVMVMTRGQSQAYKFGLAHWQAAGEPQVYVGGMHGDVQQPWRRLVHRGNIVGTVSQSAGMPTGDVIERGSNANGQYTRWADGTQMCWAVTPTVTTDTQIGTSGFYINGAGQLWIYPATFAAAPTITLTARRLTGTHSHNAMLGSATLGTTGCTVMMQAHGSGSTGTVHMHAIGRWF